jgi:hypothetical protein
MGLAVKYASRIKRLSLAQRLDDVIQQQLEEEEEEDDDDRDIDDQEGGFRTLTVGNRAGQAGNRILNTERQSEEAVTPGSFQVRLLLLHWVSNIIQSSTVLRQYAHPSNAMVY